MFIRKSVFDINKIHTRLGEVADKQLFEYIGINTN